MKKNGMDTFNHLRSISLLADLDDGAVKALAARTRIRSFEKSARIVSQEDKAQAFYIIISGKVKIFRSNEDGKEQTLYLVEEGQPFCFCTAFSDKPYPVNVSALTKSVVADIPAPDMEDLVRKEPLLMLKIMQTLAGRLLEAMNMVESLALQCANDRIGYHLLHAEASSGVGLGSPFILPLSHRETAKLIGTTPETLSRVIQGLNRKKVIEVSGKTIKIVDRKALL